MSNTVYLAVHQCEDVVFDDIVAMNTEIGASGADELLDPNEFQYWSEPQSTLCGFVKQEADGSVLFGGRMDGEWNGYKDEWVSVYGCIYTTEFNIIANHMTAGKLVIRYEEEGWPVRFFVLTPGKSEEKKASF